MSTTLARKFRCDVTSDLTLAAGFLQLNGITDFDPEVTPNLQDSTAYDTSGVVAMEPTMQAPIVTATFLRRIIASTYDPGQELVRATIGQFGNAARCGLRWYDKNGGPETGSIVAIPGWKRSQTGVANLEAITVTFTGTDGILNLNFANPGTAPTAPIILSATPTSQNSAKILTIIGTGFTGVTGATGVTIGGVNATSYIVQSDNMITAVMNTAGAGSAPLIVTNGVGASASFPYTRGA